MLCLWHMLTHVNLTTSWYCIFSFLVSRLCCRCYQSRLLTYSVNSCVLAQYTRCALCCLQPCILFVLNGCQVKIVLMIAYQWYQGDVCLYFGRSHQDQPVFQNHIVNMFCSQCHYLPSINKTKQKKTTFEFEAPHIGDTTCCSSQGHCGSYCWWYDAKITIYAARRKGFKGYDILYN